MTRTRHTVAVTLLVLFSAAIGGIALGGSAAALDPGAAATYPRTPGSSALGTFVYVVRPDDSVAQDGIETITLETQSGSFANVTNDDVFIAVRGGQRIEISNQESSIVDVSGINVSSNRGGDRLTITLPRPVQPQFASDSPNTGAEVAFKVGNFTTPSQSGSYAVNATFATASGASDGPTATNTYPLNQPALSLSNQTVSQFESSQTLNVSAAVPGGGYVGLFTTTQNGSPDQLVGSTNVSTNVTPESYSIDVGRNVSQSQRLVAVAYTESEGRSVSIRDEQTFDPTQDDRLVVNGNLVNATGRISTLDVDARLAAGGEYDQGARVYFSQGDPSTSYRVNAVDNGSIGSSAYQFETGANGSAVVNTSAFGQGQYAISRVDDRSLVSLDNDSTTGPGDDSFVVTGQQLATNGTTANGTATSGTTTGGTTASGTDTTATGADTSGTTNAGGATETAGATQTSGSGDETGGATAAGDSGNNGGGEQTGSNGPGFGVAVAVVALLGAALLATRRR